MEKTIQNIENSPKTSEKLGFFQAIALRLKKNRLGDLLLSSGIITQDQLDNALSEQKMTREPIGKVLIRQGVVSPILLYRKLAEQWCVRASALGITFMMSASAVPSSARASSQMGQVTLASAVSSTDYVKRQKIKYPSLFGSKELKSNNTKAFTKWTDMLDRFETQLSSRATTAPRLQMWKSKLNNLQGKNMAEQIIAVNNYINQVKYITDSKNWNKRDYWATPIEFFSRGGDCEDFAIAKYASLRALGVPTERMRLAIVQDKIKKIPHAILIVYADNGSTYVLDNQDKRTKRLETVSRYKPIFSINKQSWWLHKA